ncbi:MAG: hypothetical protein FJ118_19030 [Deltaproteobacteria bacterium]|nr:hypothetical protein [Deltaproteobacteria bacterium]
MSKTELTSWGLTEVRCLAGFRADERPTSFVLHDREIEVRTVLESWREPEYLYFTVETVHGRIYDLRHHEYEDWWQVREAAKGR